MILKKVPWYALVCLLCSGTPVLAQQSRVVFGASLFPPSAYIDKASGKCIGENIDITHKIFDHQPVTVEIVCAPPARMYRLIQRGDVDFTINVKTTAALAPYVEFVDTPLKPLIVNLYQFVDKPEPKTIAAIRDFDYDGSRMLLAQNQVTFIDLPTPEAALKLFLKQRSDALISYQSNIEHLLREQSLTFPKAVRSSRLSAVNAYYGVTKTSAHYALITHILNEYADTHKLNYYVPQDNPRSTIDKH